MISRVLLSVECRLLYDWVIISMSMVTTEKLMSANSLECLLDYPTIRHKVHLLAAQLDQDYCGKDLVIVGILKGSFHFISDLVREMKLDPSVEWIRVSTYGAATTPSRQSQIQLVGEVDLHNRDVLVVDDILDLGKTMTAIQPVLLAMSPNSLRSAFLLVKDNPQRFQEIIPDYQCFQVPNLWVVGYGLDLKDRYRNLKGIFSIRQI
jgi:hypoxanthine phosphoribosyltransferase